MKTTHLAFTIIATLAFAATLIPCSNNRTSAETVSTPPTALALPSPDISTGLPLNQCLDSRHSVRQFSTHQLYLTDISQLLWAAQGITSDRGYRTAPSAGALYPLTIYLVAGDCEGIPSGIYEYNPSTHQLQLIKNGDMRNDLQVAALNQNSVGTAPADIVIAATPLKTSVKYSDRSTRYIDIEVGCVVQNIYLECESLGLGTVSVGAFDDAAVAKVISASTEPRLIMPIGFPE
jgi:SagB-type dehydrogenase family enzyme